MLKENDQLQIKFDSVSILHTRLNLYSEWLFKLETTFLKSDSTKSILDILTPRLDLEHFNHKLQNSLKGCTSSSSSPILSEVAMSKYMTKRQREKSITLNSNTSRSDLLEPTIESSLDFYTNEANIDSLVEKYKSLQYKEIEFLKQSRRLNTERILLLKSFLQSVLQSPSEPINIKENPLNKIKCTSCTSSMLGRIFSSSPLNQCKLCLGLYCSVCNNVNLKQSKLKMAESADYLCPQCDRSKRPKLDTVVDFLVKFEKIQVKSFESNALQMFVNRALCWNEKYDKLTKELDGASWETRCEHGESILDEKLNALKKQELHDLHIDGLLMEIDSAKVLRLSVLMEKIEANELAELRALCDRISDLKDKIQLVESSQSVAVVSSQVSSPGALSAIRPKPAKIEKVKMNKMGKVGGELSEPDKPKIKDSRSKKPRIRESDGLHPKSRKREISQVYDSDEEQCAALKCLKPMGDNIKWVQCDGDCQKWFHMACVGITKIKRREKYLCHSCTMTPDENSNSSSSASLNNGKSGSKSALEESMEPGQDEFKSEQDVNLSMSKMETDTTESANLNATIEIIE